jgi:hypothetical protein
MFSGILIGNIKIIENACTRYQGHHDIDEFFMKVREAV